MHALEVEIHLRETIRRATNVQVAKRRVIELLEASSAGRDRPLATLGNVDGKMQKMPVRLNDLIKQGDISANVNMRPGDVLVIPESFF